MCNNPFKRPKIKQPPPPPPSPPPVEAPVTSVDYTADPSTNRRKKKTGRDALTNPRASSGASYGVNNAGNTGLTF